MNGKLVTRLDLVRKLEAWHQGELASVELWHWAEDIYMPGSTEFEDWEEDYSASNEVLAHLDNLPMNLMLPEDAPIHIKFLCNPPSDFDTAFQAWQKALDAIDFEKRRNELTGREPYAPFCKS
jgi:hypothetical protein